MSTEPARLIISSPPRQAQRRHRRQKRRLLPIAAIALIAFVVGVVEATGSSTDARQIVQRYVRDWQHGRYADMYRLLNSGSHSGISLSGFTARLTTAADTASVESLRATKIVSVKSTLALVDFRIETRVFGTLHEQLQLPLDASDSAHVKVRFAASAAFPGLRHRETLTRTTVLGKRGSLLFANGEIMADGSSLSSPDYAVAQNIAGTLESIPAADKAHYAQLGYPAGAKVGEDGLEAIYETELAGKPGGTLFAGKRVLARAKPINGKTIKTTVSPSLESAAADALGNTLSGMTVLSPDGGIEAASGIAFTDVQPPGSTFKIITSTAALSEGITSLDKTYPMESSADIGGYVMQNSAGEVCGGTLINAFATSCNSTFAPIGVQVGGKRLLAEAEKYGFNSPVAGIPTASESTIPSPIGNATAVGSSAIGQGQVQASTLEMADVAATIADRGRRPLPTFSADAKPTYVKVTTSKIAGEIQQMMIAVVQSSDGTGTTAQIPGVTIAGKTGTAELANTAGKANDTKETDSWFVAYAPAGDPKVIVCALFPNAGYGAATAAPAVKAVIEAALGIQ